MIRDLPGEWDKGRLPVCGPSFGASRVTRDTRENRRHLSPVSPEGVWNSGSWEPCTGHESGYCCSSGCWEGQGGVPRKGGGGERGSLHKRPFLGADHSSVLFDCPLYFRAQATAPYQMRCHCDF